MPTFIVAEIGINHNGDLSIAKRLISTAAAAGCDAVKFQKRSVEQVYNAEQLATPRESPFGTTNGHQKLGLEFEQADYDEIDDFAKVNGIAWFASAWDPESQHFLRQWDLKYNKIASAMLTSVPMLEAVAEEGKHTFISTGMSTLEEIDNAVALFRQRDCPFELMHCNSTYPMSNADANLRVMKVLRDRYDCDVGYSGHERGLQISIAAVALGASSLERHITLDATMYGSDQAASLEPLGLERLVRDVRITEGSFGDGVKRVTDAESAIREKLASPFWMQHG